MEPNKAAVAKERVADLSGDDREMANNAYEALVELGVDAIPSLLEVAQVQDAYVGNVPYDPRSSFLRNDDPPLGLVAMYIVDGILYGTLTPHLSPELYSVESTDQETLLSDAAFLYRQWWTEHQGLTVEELRALPEPLDGSSLEWSYSLAPVDLDSNRRLQSGIGVRISGSDTPWKIPKNKISSGLDYVIWEPKEENGPAVYNCVAWLFGVTDRWIQPGFFFFVLVKFATNRWRGVIQDYGYDTSFSGSVDCDGTCPSGTGPKILLYFASQSRLIRYSDAALIHAMLQQSDGKWSSKNGESSRYRDIEDYEAFLNVYYGDFRKRNTQSIVCYCKEPPRECFLDFFCPGSFYCCDGVCQPTQCDNNGGDGGGPGDGDQGGGGEGDPTSRGNCALDSDCGAEVYPGKCTQIFSRSNKEDCL